MKNKQLLNICYKFFNRFINADELIVQLSNIDNKELTKEDIKKTKDLLSEIKSIIKNTFNEEDEYVIKRKEEYDRIISKLEGIPTEDEKIDFINKALENLKNDKEKDIDSYDRWSKVTDFINQNDYFNECFDSLSDYELLEFIAQNIKALFPPKLTQDEFDRLVKAGIENDEREWLWRLAFNYDNQDINFDSILDYFIDKKDAYYISESISSFGNCLSIDNIIDKINDKTLIDDLIIRKDVFKKFITDEQYNRLINKGKDN